MATPTTASADNHATGNNTDVVIQIVPNTNACVEENHFVAPTKSWYADKLVQEIADAATAICAASINPYDLQVKNVLRILLAQCEAIRQAEPTAQPIYSCSSGSSAFYTSPPTPQEQKAVVIPTCC
jgi:hypothetical protein